MALISNDFFNCVLALGRRHDSDWFATGFLCTKEVKGFKRLMLVTNKHVFADEPELYIRFYNSKTGNYDSLKLTLVDKTTGTKQYSEHSSEDVAVVFLNGDVRLQLEFGFIGFDVEKGMMSSEEYFEEGGSVGSRVFMLGYPMGRVDMNKSDPICRGGYIARWKDSSFLLDIQNFPGNSGSPIICCPEPIALSGTKPLKKSSLIGVVSSYIPYKKNLIDIQTKNVVEVRDENSGLANACSVEIIREVVDEELKRNNLL